MTSAMLPYGRQVIDDDDVAAVAQVLRSDFLTTGPAVESFEAALAETVGAKYAVCCNSGTAALYLAARAAGLGAGDTVIVPAITFLATASANVLAGVEVVFADVDADTGLMGVDHAAAALDRARGKRVRALFPVHLAGQVSDPVAMRRFADERGLAVIEDACHALGTTYGNAATPVGSCAHSAAACFSFHPVKTIAMGEGGAVTTSDPQFARRARMLRNHGMTRDPHDFANADLAHAADGSVNPWYYEASEISHNLRASDINCALGASQLKKAPRFIAARRALVARYREALAPLAPLVRAVPQAGDAQPGWHLFCVLVDFAAAGIDRKTLMLRLKDRGVGTQVHYVPVHLQPFYRRSAPTPHLPGAQAYYERTLSLPLFPAMAEADVDHVVAMLAESLRA